MRRSASATAIRGARISPSSPIQRPGCASCARRRTFLGRSCAARSASRARRACSSPSAAASRPEPRPTTSPHPDIGAQDMRYLVEMRLAEYARLEPREGLVFIENYILPSLELCKTLEAQGKILAGGPISGVIGFALIVEANSAL